MMEEALINTITRIVENKRQSGIMPCHALKMEVFDEVTKGLNSLYLQRKIKVGNTLNDKWIEIIPENES